MKIIFDVTTSAQWQGNPVGIARTEKEIASAIKPKGSDIEVVYVVYRPHQSIFEKLPSSFVLQYQQQNAPLKLTDTLEPRKGVNVLFNIVDSLLDFVWSKLLPNRLKKNTICRRIEKWYSHSNVNFFAQYLPSKIKHLFYLEHRGLSLEKIDFEKKDTYISLGLDWEYPNKLDQIRKIQKEKHLKVILFCYDLIFWKRPELVVPTYNQLLIKYMADVIWTASEIMCISESSKADLVEFSKKLGLPTKPAHVITLGSKIKAKCPTVTPIKFCNLEDRQFVLFVSTIEARKNLDLIVKVWLRLYHEDYPKIPKLVIAGRPGWNVADTLSLMGGCCDEAKEYFHPDFEASDEELSWLYSNCLFSVFPSYYEGWGLPIAESLSYGKLCLASDTSSMPEVTQGLTEHISPYDSEKWYKRIKFYIENPRILAALEEEVREKYTPTTWDHTGAALFRRATSPTQLSPIPRK